MFIRRKVNAAILAAPNLLTVFEVNQKTRENENGSKAIPRTKATYGLGLKLCVSPSEIGRTKKKINHITLNQKIPKETGRMVLRNPFFLSFSKNIRAIPTKDPIETTIIPSARVR